MEYEINQRECMSSTSDDDKHQAEDTFFDFSYIYRSNLYFSSMKK